MKNICLTLTFLLVSNAIFAQTLSRTEVNLIAEIEKNYDETLALLEEVTNINSGSLNLEEKEIKAKNYF